ncbi:hypothetical protein H257_03621 [Aphanomyces astaci]|uniref:Cyclic nucleotide-binding domain-containing protein n=1 Tax=Aphanomyces astaci TaxID=112090 RepID=W4GXJ3_APHAT|nr:hypothetical protein H257_03621 [Aphanomyces astaci]ETV84402.1 hypothetical protein H257_03621 [Aphanomyces astaci]|eukprot:XP_009826094.1 hypothetical protein H257_03621 [Aphanomyces astaci]
MTHRGSTGAATDAVDGGGQPPQQLRPTADSMKFEKYRTKMVLAILDIPPYDRTDSDIRVVYQFLKDRDLFSFLSPHALLYLTAEVVVSKAQDGDVLHYQDEEVTGDSFMHIILEGSLCGYKSDAFAQRSNRDEKFPQWLASHCAESNEPLDFGECVTTFHSGAECGLTDIASKHTVHRKFSVLAQESTTAVSIRKDTMDRATAYMGAKTNSVFARQDSTEEMHSGSKSVLHSFLTSFPFMNQLPPPLQLRLVDACRQRKLRKHEPFLGPGITSHDIVVVLTGCLGLYRLDRHNVATAIEANTKAVAKQHDGIELAQVTAGESYGDFHLWSAAPTDVRRPTTDSSLLHMVVSLVATEATQVVVLDRRVYRHIAASHVPASDLATLAVIPKLDRTWGDVGDLKLWFKRQLFFQQLPDRWITRLAESAVGSPPWPSDKVVYNKSSDADFIYFVVAGAVRVQLNASDPGVDVLPGDVFGADEVLDKRKRQRVALTKAEDTILVKFPTAVYFECLADVATDITFAPTSRFRAMECYVSPPSVSDVNELAKFFRNVQVLAHLPFYIMLEVVPYLRVRYLEVGDLVCAEDNSTDEFVSVVAGHVGCHSRDRATDESAVHLFQGHAFVHVPSMHSEQVATSESGATPVEKKFTMMYGTSVHVLVPGDTCRTGFVDPSTANRRAPVTMVALASRTTIVSISEHDASQVLQRLVEWSKPHRSLKELIGQVGSLDAAGTIQFAPDEVNQVLAHLRYPIDRPDKVASDVRCLKLQPGDVVVRAGELVKHLVVVISGHVAVSVVQPPLSSTPLATSNHSNNVFAKLLTSNFKSTSKTLALVGSRDGSRRRLSTVLPSIAKLSKHTPFWQRSSSIAPSPSPSNILRIDEPNSARISSAGASSAAQNDQYNSSKNDGGDVAASQTRMRPLVTLLAGDVWGGEVVFSRNWPSLHDVVAESVAEVMLCPRETFVVVRREALAASSKKSDAHSKRILAKAHWKRANNKVVETMLPSANGGDLKPKFWRLLDQAASQRIKLIIKHLSHMELFQSMADATISAIVASARYDTVEKGEIIFKAGDAPKRYYVVVAGTIGLYSPYASLEDVCLNVVQSGGGFGEFEILTEQLTRCSRVACTRHIISCGLFILEDLCLRSLSAVAEVAAKLISFASQSFHELWDPAKLDAIRSGISFFQQLHWANRLDMDKLAHIYHTAQAVEYHKGTDVVRIHAQLNTCFVIKEGTCFLGNVLPIQAKNGTTDNIDVVQVSTSLAQVSKGHSIWVLGVATFSVTAAVANTVVYHLNYDFLKAILPKHHLGRLERQIKQHDQYHADESARLHELALHVMNTRTYVATTAGGPEMFLPRFDLTNRDVTMTDVVAATALTLADVQEARKKVDQVGTPTPTTYDDDVGREGVPAKLMGSFWKSQSLGPARRRSRESTPQTGAVAPPAANNTKLAPFFPTEVPDGDAVTSYYSERYDVNAPIRTLRLESVAKAQAALNGPRIDVEAYQVMQYVIDATPIQEHMRTESLLLTAQLHFQRQNGGGSSSSTSATPNEAAMTTIELATGLRPWKQQPPHVKTRLRPLKKLTGRQPSSPRTATSRNDHKSGKLAVRIVQSGQTNQQGTNATMVCMTATLRRTTLSLRRDDKHGDNNGARNSNGLHSFEWILKPGMRVVEWPDDAATPCEFKLDLGGDNDPRDMVTFMALSLHDKAKWVALLTHAVAIPSVADKASAFTLNPSRIVPVKKPDVVRRVQTVTEEFLPEVSYIVPALEH